MLSQTQYTLEFVGGPYDGYCQTVAIPLTNLLPRVSLPINGNVIRVVQGDAPRGKCVTRNIAVYHLTKAADGRRYEFAGTRVATEVDWDSWCVKVCEAWRKVREEQRASRRRPRGDRS